MKLLLSILLFFAAFANAQQLNKKDKAIVASLKSEIGYLADDKLEGRRTGTRGEKLAYEFISKEFAKTKLTPKGDNNSFIQEFEVNEGRQVDSSTYLFINGKKLELEKDFFPLSFSPDGTLQAHSLEAPPLGDVRGLIWFWDLKYKLEENSNNPHFDLMDAIKSKVTEAVSKGATAILLYNTSSINDELKFEPKAKTETAKIPVIYITKEAKQRFLERDDQVQQVKINVLITDKKRMGHNVVGYIDNGAATTVIIGAHYDHLGYGEDHNSLYTGTIPQIHNGADDNASGTAALIEMGRLLKRTGPKDNNYLLISFSGEELGLFGSKYFAEHPTIDLDKANYMINMDMVGRLNDSTHGLSIGGYGTSPEWGALLTQKDPFFTIKFDSSGSGPSDHTSFYRKGIPVLFFFTGIHSDYHKPSDDADKINYNGELAVIKYIFHLVSETAGKGKFAFTKTRESQSMGKSSFKVTLGIMPDYTYSGSGVRVDGVSEGKLAQRTGIKAGDVIVQLGDHKFTDVQTYMEALSKFKKGDPTKVKLKRGEQEMEFNIIF